MRQAEATRRNPDETTFHITVRMQKRWVPHFLGMLKTMQWLGGIGASRPVVFFADGDGDFRPKFSWDAAVEPVEREEQRLVWPDGREDYFFDAG